MAFAFIRAACAAVAFIIFNIRKSLLTGKK
jgi:hypothetical protein